MYFTTPGARVVDKRQIPVWRRDVILGLVLLEGSLPVDHLNPGLKHLVHYGRDTAKKGSLDWFAMFVFERNNKRVKGMVQHTAQPVTSLANNLESDITARLDLFASKKSSDFECPQPITLGACDRLYDISQRERDGMEALGVTSFDDLRAFKVATVLGVHFRTGGWGRRRCGSVITTIYRGISRYCIVNAFFMVSDETYASVTWMSTPVYPYPPFKIVVKVKLITDAEQLLHPSVIPADRIQPTSVSVMPDSDGIYFWMMRGKGIDR